MKVGMYFLPNTKTNIKTIRNNEKNKFVDEQTIALKVSNHSFRN